MKIQSSIAGYHGQPVTLIAVLEEDTGVLVVAAQEPFSELRKADDFAVVSNLDLEGVDFRFTDDMMREAITSFFELKNQGLIDILDAVARFDPENRVERQGMDANGTKYAVSPDTDCGQIGVLAMTMFAVKQRGIRQTIESTEEFLDFLTI